MLDRMTTDIWAEASRFIAEQGKDASVKAGERADDFMIAGNRVNERRYEKILSAIYWLQNGDGADPFRAEH